MVLFDSKEEKERKNQINLAKAVPTAEAMNSVEELSPAAVDTVKAEIADVRDNYRNYLIKSGEIDTLTSQISVTDLSTITNFGKESALKIGAVSDDIIKQYENSATSESSVIIDRLIDILEKIDISEIEDITKKMEKCENADNKKKLDKLLKELEKKISKVVGKYNNISKDIEDIYKELYSYENRLQSQNEKINDLYEASIDNYKELVTYVEAGKQAMIEMRDYKSKLEEESKTSGNPDIAFKISDVDTALTLMSNRVNDLATSEALALQSIPSYKIQEKANNCLQMKIQSQFITTLPALKQQIANAILTKQNAITLKGIKALDYATNKLIEQSATNAVAQLKVAQEVANTSGIKLETLTTTWNTLIAGARDYKAAEARFEQIRQQEIAAKENLNNQYLSQMTSGEVL